MDINYLYEYTDLLERVISVAYELNYRLSSVESQISHSPFFQKIEKSSYGMPPIITDIELVKQIYSNRDINIGEIPVYTISLWSAEAYLRIQEASKLTFEAIFLYIPIKRMFNYFSLYHEMDFSQIVDEFFRLYNANSVLAVLLNKDYRSTREISELLGISYETLFSYKQRRRDIKKMEAKSAYDLATLLRVRIETLLEITL